MDKLNKGIQRLDATAASINAYWTRLLSGHDPRYVTVVLWALLTVPLIFLRGYNSDEGLLVTIARTALEDGNWIVPHAFNERVVERPTLLAWVIAGISAPFGHVSQWTARLPVAISLLGGALLIQLLLQRTGSSRAAILTGVLTFLACPLVLRSYVLITADMPLAIMLFLAFVLWWLAYNANRLTFFRWTLIGVVLLLAGLLKGPQPIAYFALGVGSFVLWKRQWGQIPGLVWAGAICAVPLLSWYIFTYQAGDEGQWAHFMRVGAGSPLSPPHEAVLKFIVAILPVALIASSLIWVSRHSGIRADQRPLTRALLCYAAAASVVILFWPNGSTPRYYFPAILPLAALCGIAFDALAERKPALIAPGICATFVLLAYGLGYALIAAPLLPDRFRLTKLDADRISALVRSSPAPIYKTPVGLNVFPYVPGRIIQIAESELAAVPAPAWIATTRERAAVFPEAKDAGARSILFGNDLEWRFFYRSGDKALVAPSK